MSNDVASRLYSLLPELYRWRDEQQGRPLQAFLGILEQELHALEVDMEAMYDNWFIQTCDNWVVPYLADLLGMRDQIVQIDYLPFTQRRRVANILAYRRRKGTVAVLEQVLWDVTNWHVRAVEFYKLMSATQHLQYLQADQVVSVNLRDSAGLAALESPFSLLPRVGDVRSASAGNRQPQATQSQATQSQATQSQAELAQTPTQTANQTEPRAQGGKYSPATLGLFFWRLRAYPVHRGFAKQHAPDQPYFTFSPTGHDTQIFNQPQSFLALEQRATAVNMPILVTRAELAADLNNYHRQYKDVAPLLRPPSTTYYGQDRSFNITDIREIPKFDHEISSEITFYLNRGVIKDDLRQIFAAQQTPLSQDVSVRTLEEGKRWQVEDTDFVKSYRLTLTNGQLSVYQTQAQIVPLNLISVNLSEWPALADLRSHFADADRPDLVAVDPELGRFAFLNDQLGPQQSSASNEKPALGPQNIRVDYTYGFSSDVGGGPYPRHFTLPDSWESYCEILVVSGCQNSPLATVKADSSVLVANSFSHALLLWHTYCEKMSGKPRALIRILDNGIYTLNAAAGVAPKIALPVGAELSIVAEDGVQPTIVAEQMPLTIEFELPHPALARAAALAQRPTPAEEPPVVDRKLLFSGLRLVGGLAIGQAGEATLNALDWVVEHCSLLQGGITVNLEPVNAPALNLSILRSIVGPLRLPVTMANVNIAESIIDHQLRGQGSTAEGAPAYALAGLADVADQPVPPGPSVTIRQSTIFGKVTVEGSLQAEIVLFTAPVKVTQTKQAAPSKVRYCYLPSGSETPPGEVCLYEGEAPAEGQQCLGHIARPVFSSRHYGHPGYAQLSDLSAAEILYGVGNIAEIGVFYHLYQAQREANLQLMLDEFLPLGLNAGVFHVT